MFHDEISTCGGEREIRGRTRFLRVEGGLVQKREAQSLVEQSGARKSKRILLIYQRSPAISGKKKVLKHLHSVGSIIHMHLADMPIPLGRIETQKDPNELCALVLQNEGSRDGQMKPARGPCAGYFRHPLTKLDFFGYLSLSSHLADETEEE